MRFDRVLIFTLLLPLAGCVTTQTNTSPLGKNMPQTSKAEKAVDAARIHTELAQRYLASGNLQSAMEKLTIALKFDPNYAPAHTVMAVVDEKINRPADAEIHYRKAVELEPTKGAPNNNLGQFLCSQGRYAESETYFRKAVADPFYATPDVALTNAGICQLRGHQVAKAETDFRDAIARNPQSAEALFQLANTLYQNNDAFHAGAFLQRFDALGHPTAASLMLGNNIETHMGNQDAARSYRTRLLNQFPDSEQAHSLKTTASP